MIKTTTCARLRRADVVVGGIEMWEDADVFNANALAADNADVLAADNADVLAADTTDVLAADKCGIPIDDSIDDSIGDSIGESIGGSIGEFSMCFIDHNANVEQTAAEWERWGGLWPVFYQS